MSTTLKRGTACISCRRRKVRCSGSRPACVQCTRDGIEADCEYADGSRPSHTETLEREIKKLKSRLQELEPPMPVMLHNPSVQSQGASAGTIALSAAPGTEETAADREIYDAPAAYDDGGMIMGSGMDIELPSGGELGTTMEVEPFQVLTTTAWWDLDQPPQDCIWNVVTLLAPHAPAFGFFLDLTDEFRTTHFSDSLPVYKSLFWNAAVLWAIHFTRDPRMSVHEPVVLARTLSQLRDAIGDMTSESFLYVLQGELAVAYYLLRDARWHEARYHANAAAMLALDFGLGELGGGYVGGSDSQEFSAFQHYPGRCSVGVIEQLDRGLCANAFYNVCVLDRCLAVLLGTETVIKLETTAELFPLPGHGLVQTSSDLFLEANVSDLLYRATVIGKQGNTDNNPEEHAATIRDLDETITSFLDHIDANRAPADPGLGDHAYLTLKSLLLMARIQLKLPFETDGEHGSSEEGDNDHQAHRGCREEIVDALVAFSHLLAGLDTQGIRPFNPVLANIWIAVCHLMYVELKYVRDGDGMDQSKLERATRLTEASAQLVHELLALGENIPLKSTFAAQYWAFDVSIISDVTWIFFLSGFREKFEAMLPLMMSVQEEIEL